MGTLPPAAAWLPPGRGPIGDWADEYENETSGSKKTRPMTQIRRLTETADLGILIFL